MEDQKVCSFFVSESHLLTMLLPYINDKINDKKEIIIFSQVDMMQYLKKYLKNVKAINLNMEDILKLNWKKIKKENMEQYIIEENKDVIVIGDKEYIETINEHVQCCNELINCYKIEDINGIDKILLKYNAILNTEGKTNLLENSQNAQKRKTIKSQI